MTDDAGMLTIGQLARLSGLSTKALRHYHRLDLLRPDGIDANGYRYYGPSAIGHARTIATLRAADLPLDDVRRCLEADASDVVRSVLVHHRQRVEARSTRLHGVLHQLDHLLDQSTNQGDLRMTISTSATVSTTDAGDQRALAKDLFNAVWTLLEKEDRTRADDDRMLHMAHASRYLWEASGGSPAHLARGEWQSSRVYAVLRRGEPAVHHAQRVLDICRENSIGDWDLAFGYEAMARALATTGDVDSARVSMQQALAAAEEIADDEDRAIVMADLETIAGVPRFW